MSDAERSHDAPVPTIGSYRLVAQLGSGGMSSVYRAVHEQTGHEVAIKVLPRYLAKDPILLQRFLREAQTAEALQHPNIVAIYDHGTDAGRYYLVLEHVPGADLHDRVQHEGPRPVAEAVHVIRQVALGLKFAAGKGLIHRDIKPANVLLTPQGDVKIIDLGLALQVESDDERVTRDGTTVGTVDYMAPEQARDSHATSIRSDIYSLGCMFYYLLTGTAPFAGGDLTDKLLRHSKEAPPDVRQIRPEVPEALAQLIQKMMAKRPERRFSDYDALIAALDSVPTSAPTQEQEPTYALIDTDEDDGPDDATGFSQKGEPPQSASASTIETETQRPLRRESDLGGIPLADLAAIEEDTPASRPRSPSRPAPQGDLSWAMEEVAEDEGHDEESDILLTGPPRTSSATTDLPLKTWLIGGATVGLAFILLLVGIRSLRQTASKEPRPVGVESLEVPPEPPEVVAVEPEPIDPRPQADPAEPRPAPAQPPMPTVQPAPAPFLFVEPTDQEPSVVAEEPFAAGVEARFPAIVKDIDAPVAEPIVTVRRLGAVNLTLEVGKFQGTVEIADNGPFFEDNLTIGGLSRRICAARGYRPIVVLEPPLSDEAKKRPAIFVLEKKRVTLEGLDLVVDASSLPATQGALFLCRGTELTLRDCTVTVVGPEDLPFALVRVEDLVGSTRRSSIKLERTFVRGRGVTAIDLGTAAADLDLSRSVLVCGSGPVISVGGEGATSASGTRTLRVYRSICASRGPMLRVVNVASAGAGNRLQVRALGSTFAQVGGSSAASLIAGPNDSRAQPRDLVDWGGDLNEFIGWPSWLRNQARDAVSVSNLADARRAWGQTDAQSREQTTPWTETIGADRLSPADLLPILPAGAPILTQVAWPSPNLRPRTVESFARAAIPGLTAAAAPATGPPPRSTPGTTPQPTTSGARTGEMPQASGGGPNPSSSASAPEVFNVTAAPWVGDLGRFVADRLAAGAKVLRIVARGAGPFEMTPIRLPEGTSLTISVEPPTADGAPPLSWKPKPGVEAESLIGARGADLSLSGVRLTLDGTSKVRHLIAIEDGQVALSGCHLTAPGTLEPGGAMIAFRAATSRPFLARPGAPYPAGDRPVCRLVDCLILTGGDALSAEVARGVVALENCAIACGGCAVALRPQAVRRDLFQADLWLDRCTFASARAFVELGPWNGWRGGPDRPWLVSSRRCAFVDSFARDLRESPLLLVDAEAMARGVLFWQAERDAYEVARFATTDPNFIPERWGPDVRRLWIELWGSNHIVNVIGPLPNDRDPVVRVLGDRLKLTSLVPGDLALIPDSRPGRTNKEIGADLARLNLTPSRGPTRSTSRAGG